MTHIGGEKRWGYLHNSMLPASSGHFSRSKSDDRSVIICPPFLFQYFTEAILLSFFLTTARMETRRKRHMQGRNEA
jgi:hypothetical protein